MNKKVIAVCLTTALMMSTLSACGNKAKNDEDVPDVETGIAVNTTVISNEDFAKVVHIGGTTQAASTVSVMAKIASMEKILGVNAEVGDKVYAGEVLAVLDGESTRLQYDSTKLQYDDAVRSLDRLTALKDAGAIADKDYEQALLGVQSLEKSLAGLQLSLNEMQVKATITGTITTVNAEVGAYASAQAPMFEIADIDELEVGIGVNENMVHKISVGDKVEVSVPSAKENSKFSGVITEIGKVMTQGAKSYPVTISIDNTNGELLAGMYADVAINTDNVTSGIVIPVDAIGYNDGKPYVMTVVDGKAVETMIETGINDGDYYEVLSGLKVGDEVVVKGNDNLVDGEKVSVVNGSGINVPKSDVKEDSEISDKLSEEKKD